MSQTKYDFEKLEKKLNSNKYIVQHLSNIDL